MSNEYENAQENNNQETGQIEAQGVGQDGMVEQQERALYLHHYNCRYRI